MSAPRQQEPIDFNHIKCVIISHIPKMNTIFQNHLVSKRSPGPLTIGICSLASFKFDNKEVSVISNLMRFNIDVEQSHYQIFEIPIVADFFSRKIN